ncbi:MAG: cyclic nucleotide-binding domain-containing protein [Rhodospirillaceae bacterium]|nr:cyclic nucleotide-binding domain-containing protein [Rhodospirillaceae bacterium]
MASQRPPGSGPAGHGNVAAGPAAAQALGGKPASVVPAAINLDPKNMERVIAFVAEHSEVAALSVAAILQQAGVKNTTTFTKLSELHEAVEANTPDLLIIGAHLDPGIFGFIRDIRHSKLGTNPFLMITTLVEPDQVAAVKKTMQAGTDDIILKPVKEDQLLQRLRRVTVNRQAFVVTSDYLGPDRRAKSRPSSIRRIQVLNTMLEKANGRDIQAEDIKAAVDGSMNDVLHARLDSNSYRLGFVCNIIIEAYRSNNVTPDVKEKILVLVDVLRDAAKTAERINESEMALLCGSLAKDVEAIAERYMTPTERDLKVIQKLTRAVMMVVKPHVPPEQLERETREAAENYLKHQREQFGKSHEIQRTPQDEPVNLVDEAVLEIMPLAKGQTLFKQGDEATAVYIVASGSIAIYREIDGKQVPVARVKKGEFFGEMAIIDGTPRRATAVALEDCTLSLITKDVIEEKMRSADPLIAQIMHTFITSLRHIPETFSPKGRNVRDIATELSVQSGNIARLIESSRVPAITSEGAPYLQRLQALVGDINGLLAQGAQKDPRLSARPSTREIERAEEAAG